jgi:hypothetical protein
MAVTPPSGSPSVEFVAETVPAEIVNVSFTTLFDVAVAQFGDPLQWVPIASINALVDPWIAQAELKIPPILPTGTPSGVLTPTTGLASWPA